jgi:hypothetical protein
LRFDELEGKEVMVRGLCVKGLDSSEISKRLERYVSDYFNGFALNKGTTMFSEGFILDRPEVLGIIPVKHHPRFSDTCKFLGLSGYITATCSDGSTTDHVIMLLLDEKHEHAFFLCTHEADEDGTPQTVIIKDFLAYHGGTQESVALWGVT